jgi:glycerol kinase
MNELILAIDQGTTGTTACLFHAKDLTLLAKYNLEFTQHFPHPGYVEHDLNEIWESVRTSTLKVLELSKASAKSIIGIGITNQRETTCLIDSQGVPLYRALVWQDRRTKDFCDDLKKQNLSSKIKSTTGLTLDPYFSATKMDWLKKNVSSRQYQFCTMDTYLLMKLTSGASFATDATNASRTMLMNLSTGSWDKELLKLFNIQSSELPEIKNTFDSFGKTKGLDFLPDGIPITGMIGDQQSALLGQAGVQEGDMKCTYGTGAFLLANTGSSLKYSNTGLLTTVAYANEGKLSYALEGSSYIAGAAVQWFRDQLGAIKSSAEIEELAMNISNREEVKDLFFLPFFSGIGSPYWIPDAKAMILGMNRGTSSAHLAYALLEGVAFSIKDLISPILKEFNLPFDALKVDGGMSANDFFLQIQANVLQHKVLRPKNIETTATGAAVASLIGLGKISLTETTSLNAPDRMFTPDGQKKSYFEKKHIEWEQIIKRNFL